MDKIVKTALIAGGVTLAIVGLESVFEAVNQDSAPGAERPVREDVFLSNLDGNYIGDWVEAQHQTYGDSILCILARVTDKMAKMLLMEEVPEELDRDSHLLLSAIDREKKLPKVTYQINFGRMDASLAELLGQQEYVLITK